MTINHHVAHHHLRRAPKRNQARRARFTASQFQRAELFQVGYGWDIERRLETLKEAWLTNEAAVRDGEISRLTFILQMIRDWTPKQACEFLRQFDRGDNRSYVQERIDEAQTAHMELAAALALSTGPRQCRPAGGAR